MRARLDWAFVAPTLDRKHTTSAPESARAARLDDVASVGEATHLTDRALFDAIVCGDERLAPIVYQRLLPVIDTTLQRLLGCRCQDREELVRHSFERSIGQIARHPQPWVCGLSVWASSQTAQVALRALRLEQHEPSASMEPETGLKRTGLSRAPREPERTGAHAPHRAGLDHLRGLLSELAPQRAAVIVLHHVLCLGILDVAITTGTSLESVADHLARGRQQLATRMAASSGQAGRAGSADAVV